MSPFQAGNVPLPGRPFQAERAQFWLHLSPLGFDGKCQKKKRSKIVDSWKPYSCFLQSGFEIFLSALLAVKPDGVVATWLARAPQKQHRVPIAFGLADPLLGLPRHRGLSHSPADR